jgi:hypothetical protein
LPSVSHATRQLPDLSPNGKGEPRGQRSRPRFRRTTRLMRRQLYGLGPYDPITMLFAVGVMTSVAVLLIIPPPHAPCGSIQWRRCDTSKRDEIAGVRLLISKSNSRYRRRGRGGGRKARAAGMDCRDRVGTEWYAEAHHPCPARCHRCSRPRSCCASKIRKPGVGRGESDVFPGAPSQDPLNV